MTDLLEVQRLQKSYGAGSTALKILGDLSFSVRAGEFLSIVGPSGCGKTTLLMVMAGLIAADGGRVRFKGSDVVEPPAGLSVVFQDYSRSLFPWKTTRENVVFGMRRLQGRTRAEQMARADEILDAVGLTGFADRYPWQLSGGMQQRVAIARALAMESELLLLDEPLAAVDAQTRADMQDLILDLARRFSQTVVLVTHDVDEAVYMADRVIVLTRRPTAVDQEIAIDLGKARDQLTTREDARYLKARHQVLERIRSFRAAAPLSEKA